MKALFLLFTLLFSLNSHACKCRSSSIETKVSSADYVYFGQVVSSKLIGEKEVVNEMKVIEVIKGKPDSSKLYSRVENHMCSMYAATGLTFIVYGNYNEKARLSLCSDTQPLVKGRDVEFEKKLTNIKAAANPSFKQDD